MSALDVLLNQKLEKAQREAEKKVEPTEAPVVEEIAFKKPVRRNTMRKRERPAEEESEPKVEQPVDGDGAAGTSNTISLMMELQKQRKRSHGLSMEPTETLDEVEEALAAEKAEAAAAADNGLDSTFTSQTDAGDIDHNMLKYIEEQMQGGKGGDGEGGGEAAPRATALSAEEAELYTTPAELRGVLPAGGASKEVVPSSPRRKRRATPRSCDRGSAHRQPLSLVESSSASHRPRGGAGGAGARASRWSRAGAHRLRLCVCVC